MNMKDGLRNFLLAQSVELTHYCITHRSLVGAFFDWIYEGEMHLTTLKNVQILYAEELKAAIRGRFAWLGAAVVLLSIGGLAAIATQDTWLDGYGVVAYFLAPICFMPLAAGSLAGPRANRFVESIFTAPVERLDWLIAKTLVVLTIALAYYLALLPMMAIYISDVGFPFLLMKFVEWTPGILVASIAMGSLIGVLFIGRSVAPPIATSVGLMLFCAVLVPLQELLVAQGYGAKATGHLALASPFNLLKNGLGFTLAAGSVPASTALTWFSFAIIVTGSFGLAGWIFLRAQGVESWESNSRKSLIITVAIGTLFLLPVMLADTDYDQPAPAANNAPTIKGVFLRGGGSLALVSPGRPQPARCCDALLNRDQWPTLPTDQATKQDLLFFLPVSASDTMTALEISVGGQNGLKVDTNPETRASVLQHLETRDYPPGTGPTSTVGQHITSGWVIRLPVALRPTSPWDIGGVRYPLDVAVNYSIAGDPQQRSLNTQAAVEAHVPGALMEMAGTAAILPLICMGLAVRRWRRTR